MKEFTVVCYGWWCKAISILYVNSHKPYKRNNRYYYKVFNVSPCIFAIHWM